MALLGLIGAMGLAVFAVAAPFLIGDTDVPVSLLSLMAALFCYEGIYQRERPRFRRRRRRRGQRFGH